MSGWKKCAYCQELAVTYRTLPDGRKIRLCAYHIRTKEDGADPASEEGEDDKVPPE